MQTFMQRCVQKRVGLPIIKVVRNQRNVVPTRTKERPRLSEIPLWGRQGTHSPVCLSSAKKLRSGCCQTCCFQQPKVAKGRLQFCLFRATRTIFRQSCQTSLNCFFGPLNSKRDLRS